MKLLRYIGPQLRMPWWLFWSILLSITWFYLIRRVISWDLWWHMAAGRYTLENGSYPVTGTFTYSPVKDTLFTSRTWLGDIVLHLTHDWFGFYGLQFLRASFILSGVLFMLHLVKFRYNLWTLLISAMMIIGTMQKHLIKNAIFVIPAMSFLTWSWIQIKYYKKTYLIYFYLPLFFVWFHFHGSVMVGACYLFLLLLGDFLDSVIMPFLSKINYKSVPKFFESNLQFVLYLAIILGALFISWIVLLLPVVMLIALILSPYTPNLFKSLNTKVSDHKFLIKFALICLPIFISVHSVYRLPFLSFGPLNTVFQAVGVLPAPKKTVELEGGKTAVVAKAKKPSQSTLDKLLTNLGKTFDESQPLKTRLKNIFRIVFGGTDAKLVAEYQWPFEILYVLSVKSLFLMVVIYACYVLFRLAVGLNDFKWSIELPNLLLVYLSLGYLRTLSYPFVSAVIFFSFAIFISYKELEKGDRFKKGVALIGMTFFLLCLWAMSPLFSEFVNLFFNALKDKNQIAKDARFIAIPILLFPLVTGLLLITKSKETLRKGLNIFTAVVGLYILVCLAAFSVYQNETYRAGNFHTVTGFLDTEPGLGKSNKFFDGMADWVTENLPPKNIYNSYNMGGYLLWKWYLDRKVFIDGRSIIYEKNFYQAYTTNNASEYIKKEDLEHAILNTVVDKDRILMFSKQDWYPIMFDPCMVILKRPKKYEEPFGVLPDFQEGERPLEDLENLDRMALAEFINTAVNHMMLYGRMKDAHDWMVQLQPIINQIPEAKKQLNDRLNHIKLIGKSFGFHNHRAMAMLSKEIFNKVKGAKYHKVMGAAHLALNQYPQAEGQYIRAFQIKKDDVDTLIKLGQISFLLKKHQQSAQFYAEAIKHKPKDPQLSNAITLPLIELNKLDQAIQYGVNAVKLSPNFAEAYFTLGRIFQKKKDIPRAIAHIQKAIQLKPGLKEAQVLLQKIAADQAKLKQEAAKKATPPKAAETPVKAPEAKPKAEKK